MSGDLNVYMILVDHRSSELWNVRDLAAVIDCTDSNSNTSALSLMSYTGQGDMNKRERAACAKSDWT